MVATGGRGGGKCEGEKGRWWIGWVEEQGEIERKEGGRRKKEGMDSLKKKEGQRRKEGIITEKNMRKKE